MSKIHGMIFGELSIKAFQRTPSKTQTRRVSGLQLVNENPDNLTVISVPFTDSGWMAWRKDDSRLSMEIKCPWAVGDYVYSKEKHILDNNDYQRKVIYWADTPFYKRVNYYYLPWRSSIFQFRQDARFWFRITEIRAQRLWDISYADCVAEGVSLLGNNLIIPYHIILQESFALRDALNPKYPSSGNPYLWALTLKKCEAQ